MIKRYFTLLFLFIFVIGCSNRKKITVPEETGKAAPVFFPITTYLEGQISEFGQLQITPLKITTLNEQVDSSWLKTADLPLIAEPFLHPFIDSAILCKYYNESSFLDQTINSITLAYDPKSLQEDPLSLKSLAVYIDPQSNKVTRIFIEKIVPENKSTHLQQLTWKTGRWFKITTITETAGKVPEIKEEKVIWNFDQD
ncbi:MAG: hypothetical protein ABJA57_06925 [Ginsengibacter sp.]